MFGMSVNMSKTKVLVFRGPRTKAPVCEFSLGGGVLAMVDELKYMGVHLHAQRGMFAGHAPVAAKAAYKASFAMTAKNRARGLRQPAFLCQLFGTLVEPVLSYACQVWGPEGFAGRQLDQPFQHQIGKVQVAFLRSFCGLSSRIRQDVLLHEFGQLPVMHHWVALAARLWNSMAQLPETALLRHAFTDAVDLYLDGCQACWVGRMLGTLGQLGLLGNALDLQS